LASRPDQVIAFYVKFYIGIIGSSTLDSYTFMFSHQTQVKKSKILVSLPPSSLTSYPFHLPPTSCCNIMGCAFTFLIHFSVHFVVEKYLQEREQLSFDVIFSERIGYRLFRKFIVESGPNAVCSKRCIKFHEMITEYRGLDCTVTRKPIAKRLYNEFIMPDLLVMDHPFDLELASYVNDSLSKDETDLDLFDVSW
jgi:hypothetical protein